jgi:hypothetical protein
MAKTLPKAGPDLVSLIQAGLKQKREADPPKPDDWIRVSSLSTLCARAEVLAGTMGVKRDNSLEFYQQLTFDMGKGVHWTVQNNVLPKLNVLVGEWQCADCGHVYGGPGKYVLRPDSCTWNTGNPLSCGKNPPTSRQADESSLTYVEQFFQNEEYRVQGHPDGFLRMAGMKSDGVLEAKSISDRRFKDVKDVPDFGHVIQLQAYLWLTGLDWGLLLYWNKGAWKDPLVQHVVERDEDSIDGVKRLVTSIREGLKGGAVPDRICSSRDCKRAEECVMRDPCFEGAL